MLDIKFIQDHPQEVKAGLRKRLFKDLALVDKVLDLDQQKKKLTLEIEALRAERNKTAGQKNISEGKRIKEELKKKEPVLSQTATEIKNILLNLPNLPLADVPEGPAENKKVVKRVGKAKKFDFAVKDHLELGKALGIIDVERAAKVSGTRFAYLKGEAALLEFALINFALEKLIAAGFLPILPPMLIKKEITQGLGYWNGGGNENYYYVLDFDEKEGEKELDNPLYLIGTGEHAVVPLHAGEILPESQLPKKYVAFSSCFRREAGSYGQDTKGILRVHQFDKVEMIALSKPGDSEELLEKMLNISENLLQELDLPYQVVNLAAGDISFPTAKTYDLETWLPGQDKYRETHSISTTTDYQSRRLNIKYQGQQGNGYVHILNGTALAIGRTIIAILENYQSIDGSVTIPKVLQKWMGKARITV